jgi:hypothetical protein
MKEDSSIIRFRQPDEIDDPLTALLRSGARRLLEQAIEAEVEAFLASRKELKRADGRDSRVRHGQGSRPGSRPGIRAHPVQLGAAAALSAPDDESGCPAADPVSARCLGR